MHDLNLKIKVEAATLNCAQSMEKLHLTNDKLIIIKFCMACFALHNCFRLFVLVSSIPHGFPCMHGSDIMGYATTVINLIIMLQSGIIVRVSIIGFTAGNKSNAWLYIKQVSRKKISKKKSSPCTYIGIVYCMNALADKV